ncbi:MAG: MmpS family transport accessory protein [Spirochaetes bacterium]|nr:MmpS family transport accessory protein [Spirochaetota bacterium]
MILIVFSLFIVAGCGSSPITVEIKYEVTGTVPSANITYQNFTGATDTLTGFALPWSKTFTVTIDRHRSFHAHVRAGNSTTGSLTANIYVNGILVRTSTNSGSFQLVSISYTIWNN